MSTEKVDSSNSFHSKYKTKQKATASNDDLTSDKPLVQNNSSVVLPINKIVKQEELSNNKNTSTSFLGHKPEKLEENKKSKNRVNQILNNFNKVIDNSTNKNDTKPAEKLVSCKPNKSKVEELKNKLFSSIEETNLTGSKTNRSG